MRERDYYSIRTGKNPHATIKDLSIFSRLLLQAFTKFDQDGYFQEAFGYACADSGEVLGSLGNDIEGYLFLKMRKLSLWPIVHYYERYSEDDVFDMIEFLYDWISKPVDGSYHEYNYCGWHYYTFDQAAGREEFRIEINQTLRDYQDGFELSEAGEILRLPDRYMSDLLQTPSPGYDEENVDARVDAAAHKYRRRVSSPDDRRDAVRDLADVLEFLRPKLKCVLDSSDEADLFNIANNFGIRHHRENQKTNYDKDVWYDWMFHYYLATIHACLRMLKKQKDDSCPF